MANLFITIISIALVAIAAIAAAYYGGMAYTNARTGAMATTLVEQIQQVAAAGALWRGNYGVTSVCDPVSLSGNYANGLCGGGLWFQYGWGVFDAGKYIYPLPQPPSDQILVAGDFSTIISKGGGEVILDGVTYEIDFGFYNDGNGDFYSVTIEPGGAVWDSSSRTNPTPSMTYVKICQQINAHVPTLPIGITMDAITGLPVSAAGANVYGPYLSGTTTASVPPNICFLNDFGGGIYALSYYVRM